MPPKTTATSTRLDNIVACLTPVIPLLTKFSDGFGTPFIPAIANTTLSLITLVQNAKKNKEECMQLMENVDELLYAVINIHIKSGTGSSLPPATLSAFGELTQILHKVHAFMEAQQDGSRIKHFFRQNEMKTLLNECHTGLKQAFDMFKMEGAINIHGNIVEMQNEIERIHNELLEAISTSSKATISDRSSSIHHSANDLDNSSNSISMLPAQPKILHGRESELKHIAEILHQESARIAILGAGGMGKTCLAKAVLHHADIISKYQYRFFVAAESATTSIELAALIGLHIGLKSGKDVTKPVVEYFTNNGPTLLVLDNLETLWEPMESRGGVEEFLSCLTDITMRGAERPAKVHWTHPFLQPLEPLSDDAAHETFIDIAEDFHDSKDIRKLLSLTDNMPLAVDLIAHLVDQEGCEDVLVRWEREKTSLLSSGHDRRSNLDMSITFSLLSPRLSPGAKDLLSLLSILPDGLSDAELLQSRLSMKNILECKSMLLRTSLAYQDNRKRLKSLMPIREHMQQFYPAPLHLIHQVEKHFHLLLDVAGQLNQITSNLGNLHQVLLRGLKQDNPILADTINCTLFLNRFSRVSGLEASFIIEVFTSWQAQPIINPEQLITQAICHFGNFDDPLLESKFYHAVGQYYLFNQGNISKANQFFDKALVLAKSCGNKKQQATVLSGLAMILWNIGDHPAAQIHARRAQRLAQLSADLSNESCALSIEGMCTQDLGDYRYSMLLFHRARKLLELCGMSHGVMNHNIMTQEAETHLLKSQYVEARSIHTEIVQDTQDTNTQAFSLVNLAEIDIRIGAHTQDVHQNLDKAREIFTAAGGLYGLKYCDILLGQLNLRESETSIAKLRLHRCFTSVAQKYSQVALLCLESLADTSQWPASDFNWTSQWTVIYLVYAKGKQSKRELHKALQFLGDVFLTQRDLDTANSLFTVALETFTYMDIHRSRAECMLRLGDISEKRGHLVETVEFWNEAQPLFERALQRKEITLIDTRLAVAHKWMLDGHAKTLALPIPSSEYILENIEMHK
ncbi:hypothetical protein C8R44DRAFT_740769 [Mycena epipterygia]|nr:hypothetical protein C8R44DRAFT_740769 [Mycena epipterygia]